MDPAPFHARWTPNLFGIAFGFAGLADCWTTAHLVRVVPAWPGNVFWVTAALLWFGIGGGYLGRPIARRRLRAELADPVFAPFLALIPVLPMLFGVALAGYAPGVGRAVFVTALVATVALGGWLTGEWILSDTRLEQWHPGYLLPTVAAGFLAAQGSAVLGYTSLARLLFGYGLVSWLMLGSILLTRLFTASALPAPLVPTVAIQVAPPVVAGAAWFAMNGGRPDAIACGLAGYALLMVLVQLRLIPLYRTVPFAPGWWSFSFSGAAVINDALLWLGAEHIRGQLPVTITLLVVVTTGIGLLAATTASAVRRHAFLPRTVVQALSAAPAASAPRTQTSTAVSPAASPAQSVSTSANRADAHS